MAILRAAAPLDDHAGQTAVHHVVVLVEVEHGDGGHLSRAAARLGRVLRRQVHEVRVRELLERQQRTLAAAEVGVVPFGGDDKVPAELDKVDLERITTAQLLLRRIVAVEADASSRPPA